MKQCKGKIISPSLATLWCDRQRPLLSTTMVWVAALIGAKYGESSTCSFLFDVLYLAGGKIDALHSS